MKLKLAAIALSLTTIFAVAQNPTQGQYIAMLDYAGFNHAGVSFTSSISDAATHPCHLVITPTLAAFSTTQYDHLSGAYDCHHLDLMDVFTGGVKILGQLHSTPAAEIK